jgi:pimeloyl-ACP methyl ester carboxylesterase
LNEAAILPQFWNGCEEFKTRCEARLAKLCSVPHIKAGDIHVYYELHGSGAQTLTLIRGLGADLLAWFAQVPEFSRHFQTLVFDNRGAGRTDKPDEPYTIQQMASDLNSLLHALQIERTALLGISMGGMIAQEFAIHYPEKLSCLILGCTSFGGPQSVSLPRDMLNAILAGPVADEQVRKLQERALYSDDTILANRGLIAAHADARSKFPTPPFALSRQAAALLSHDTASRLAQIGVPTLVLTGKEDRLIPPANSRLIAERIPGAILTELPGGHLFASEHADVFNPCVIDFVKVHR